MFAKACMTIAAASYTYTSCNSLVMCSLSLVPAGFTPIVEHDACRHAKASIRGSGDKYEVFPMSGCDACCALAPMKTPCSLATKRRQFACHDDRQPICQANIQAVLSLARHFIALQTSSKMASSAIKTQLHSVIIRFLRSPRHELDGSNRPKYTLGNHSSDGSHRVWQVHLHSDGKWR